MFNRCRYYKGNEPKCTYTPKEIVKDVIAVGKTGTAVAHIHVRNKKGTHKIVL